MRPDNSSKPKPLCGSAKRLVLIAIVFALSDVNTGHAQSREPQVAPEPERCSEAWFDFLVDEAAKAEEKLVALQEAMGPNPSEDESFELTIARADAAAARTDALSARRECGEIGSGGL